MENMLLQEGDVVQVKNASLAKGTYMKLQPHTKDFLDISNPKAMLVNLPFSYIYLSNSLVPCVRTCYSSLVSYLNVHLQVGKIIKGLLLFNHW
jgi:ubiquitin fusion degradation protein 1